MNLRRRQKRKTEQALDAVASATKLWSEWQIGKRAVKGAAKIKDVRPPSKLKKILSLKWVKIGGAVAVAGGAAAAIGRKLKGGDPADYSGPPPSVAADAAVPSPEAPPPLSVAPDPATQERDTEPASGASALRENRDDTSESEPDDPELVSDDAGEDALDALSDSPGTEDPAVTPGDDAADGADDATATPGADDADAATADAEPQS